MHDFQACHCMYISLDRHSIFLGYCQSSRSSLIYGMQLVPQSHESISTFDLRNFTQNDNHASSLCDIPLYDALLVSCGKDIISAARGRSTESAARERSEGPQCERCGSTIIGHLRAH